MSCFITNHMRNFTFDVAIFGHHYAPVHTAQRIHRGFCHLPSGFSCRHKPHPSALQWKVLQRPPHRLIRQHCMKAGRYNLSGVSAQLFFHVPFLLSEHTLQQSSLGHGSDKPLPGGSLRGGKRRQIGHPYLAAPQGSHILGRHGKTGCIHG